MLGVSGFCMSVTSMYRQKMDVSICDNKVSYPKYSTHPNKTPRFFNFLRMKWFIIKQHWRRIWRERFEVNLEETFVHQHKM